MNTLPFPSRIIILFIPLICIMGIFSCFQKNIKVDKMDKKLSVKQFYKVKKSKSNSSEISMEYSTSRNNKNKRLESNTSSKEIFVTKENDEKNHNEAIIDSSEFKEIIIDDELEIDSTEFSKIESN